MFFERLILCLLCFFYIFPVFAAEAKNEIFPLVLSEENRNIPSAVLLRWEQSYVKTWTDSLAQSDFIFWNKRPAFGFQKQSVLIKLPVYNPTNLDRWLLRFDYKLLGYASIFVVQNKKLLYEIHGGDNVAFKQGRTLPLSFLNFELKIPPHSHVDLYLSVYTKGSLNAMFSISSPLVFAQHAEIQIIFIVVVLTILITLGIYTSLLALAVKATHLVLPYFLHICFLFVYLSSLYRISYAYFWSSFLEFNKISVSLFISALNISAVWFSSNFLALQYYSRKLFIGANVFLVFLFVILVLNFFVDYFIMIRIVSVASMFISSSIVFVAFYIAKQGYQAAYLFMYGWGTFLFATFLHAGSNYFFPAWNMEMANLQSASCVFEAILFSLAIADVVNHQKQEYNAKIRKLEIEKLEEKSKAILHTVLSFADKINSPLTTICNQCDRMKNLVKKAAQFFGPGDTQNYFARMDKSLGNITEASNALMEVSRSLAVFREREDIIENKEINLEQLLKDIENPKKE